MGKLYVINFDESKDKIDFAGDEMVQAGNGMVGYKLIKGTRKELELRILSQLFKNAMNSQTEISKSFECKDCIDQVKNVDKEKFIKFEKGDMDFLKLGFTKTADRRPDVWMDECFNLFKQIENPKEEEIKKK